MGEITVYADDWKTRFERDLVETITYGISQQAYDILGNIDLIEALKDQDINEYYNRFESYMEMVCDDLLEQQSGKITRVYVDWIGVEKDECY